MEQKRRSKPPKEASPMETQVLQEPQPVNWPSRLEQLRAEYQECEQAMMMARRASDFAEVMRLNGKLKDIGDQMRNAETLVRLG